MAQSRAVIEMTQASVVMSAPVRCMDHADSVPAQLLPVEITETTRGRLVVVLAGQIEHPLTKINVPVNDQPALDGFA